ncbi:hypothetical protein B0T26DRAFT_678322 [Lasiosphaeria miniovina]|uniref:Uncharacterized protein n=1 Tax=Lasiosphaeria miniovina TaxID=1954250 RepID=A0AA40DS18_9PEZI|nr:uncharacterized protein B0T26DRAFT_678322 [Lasiosphaeria miniovina]KAK0714064.1 hypothetical protein B0T26DRAFT_678322 [Lasiosphaeria miniovina]
MTLKRSRRLVGPSSAKKQQPPQQHEHAPSSFESRIQAYWKDHGLAFDGRNPSHRAPLGPVVVPMLQFYISQFITDAAPVSVRALDGIRAALRERNSTDPLDHAFALWGDLQTCDATTSHPDYSLNTEDTFRLLWDTLIAWDPRKSTSCF